jgi:hypothetical protein
MQEQEMDRNDHGKVRVYLCFACAGIWFDHLASVQLSPAAVISLFKEIHANKETPRQTLSNSMYCPHCNDALTLSQDLCKSGRFSYFRCLRGDGRFTPFLQFLREKQFIRNLTPLEIKQVSAKIKQVTCSECGAPIDLDGATQCQYCHSPISVLDPQAVEKALALWSGAEERRQRAPSPAAVAEALMRITPRTATAHSASDRVSDVADLVEFGVNVIGAMFAD